MALGQGGEDQAGSEIHRLRDARNRAPETQDDQIRQQLIRLGGYRANSPTAHCDLIPSHERLFRKRSSHQIFF